MDLGTAEHIRFSGTPAQTAEQSVCVWGGSGSPLLFPLGKLPEAVFPDSLVGKVPSCGGGGGVKQGP